MTDFMCVEIKKESQKRIKVKIKGEQMTEIRNKNQIKWIDITEDILISYHAVLNYIIQSH